MLIVLKILGVLGKLNTANDNGKFLPLKNDNVNCIVYYHAIVKVTFNY